MKLVRDQLKIDVSDQDDNAATGDIFARLWSYREKKGGPAQRQLLTITVRNLKDAVIDGLCGRTAW